MKYHFSVFWIALTILLIGTISITASGTETFLPDLDGSGSVTIADVTFLLNYLSGVGAGENGFFSEEEGIRLYENGVFRRGVYVLDGKTLHFDEETGVMTSEPFTLDGWSYPAAQPFERDGRTLYAYGKPSLVPLPYHRVEYSLRFDKTDLVSTKYDTKTYTEGAVTAWYLWYSTDYIDVSGNYAIGYTLSGHKYLQSVSFYDENKRYLSGRAIDSSSDCVTLREVVRLPEGAKYVRCINRIDGGPMTLDDSELFGLPSQEDYHEHMRRYPNENKKIVLIGDSLTEGDQGSDRSGVTNKTTYNYPYYLSQILSCNAESNGRCGITVSGYFSFYGQGQVNAANADLVLVMLGTNGGINDEQTKQSYRNLIKLITADLKPGGRIVLVTPPHATEVQGKVNYGYNDNVRSAAAFARELAAEKGLLLIDAYTDSPITAENEDLYQPNDGLHMGKEGYRAFAQFIAGELQKAGCAEETE